ncbi:MAG: methyltransferase domain-containing protein [Magnetococcus sp. WYHC-3]
MLGPLRVAKKQWLRLARSLELRRARHAFARAALSPSWLDPALLPVMQHVFPPAADYPYDPDSLLRRGQTRADLLQSLPDLTPGGRSLEVGCGDGMVSAVLARRGFRALAGDYSARGVDARCRAWGAQFVRLDAGRLPLPAACMDLVFSFDAFEHFPAPDLALEEMIRVCRPGGLLFLDFGPLYYSQQGLHGYRSLNVPYCQHLFPREVLEAFIDQEGLPPVDFAGVNGWSASAFRALFQRQAHVLTVLDWQEGRNLYHLDLIRHHPSCFRAKSDCFEDFVISSMRLVLRRREAAGGN